MQLRMPVLPRQVQSPRAFVPSVVRRWRQATVSVPSAGHAAHRQEISYPLVDTPGADLNKGARPTVGSGVSEKAKRCQVTKPSPTGSVFSDLLRCRRPYSPENKRPESAKGPESVARQSVMRGVCRYFHKPGCACPTPNRAARAAGRCCRQQAGLTLAGQLFLPKIKIEIQYWQALASHSNISFGLDRMLTRW